MPTLAPPPNGTGKPKALRSCSLSHTSGLWVLPGDPRVRQVHGADEVPQNQPWVQTQSGPKELQVPLPTQFIPTS